MWIDKVKEDPYNRRDGQPGQQTSVGAGGGSAADPGSQEPGNAASAPTPTAAPVAPQQSFASVQDYFKANKQQGDEFGQKFTNKLDQTVNQQKDTITGATKKAQEEVVAGTAKENPFLTARAATDPNAVAKDKGQTDAFMNQWNAAYRGPESFEASNAYGEAANATAKANEKKEQLKSVGGRQQLVQDEFGVYGQGNRGLDEALLQTSSFFPQVQAQEKQFGALQDYLKNQSLNLAPDVSAAKAASEKTRQDTRSAVQGGIQNFVSSVDANVKKAQDNLASQTAAVQRALENPNAVNDSVLKALGLTRNEFDKLQKDKAVAAQGWNAPGDKDGQIAGKSFNLADYFKTNPLDVSRRTTVSQADIDKAKGFATLTQDQNILPTIGDQAAPGTFTSFDKAKAEQELGGYAGNVSAAQKAYQAKLDATRPNIPASNPSDGVLRSQPVLPSDGSGGQSGSNPKPAVNPEYNPNNIQFDSKGNPITPEGATGVFKTPDGVWTPIADMKGVQTETSSLTPKDFQTVDTQGGTEKLPQVPMTVINQINSAVDLRRQSEKNPQKAAELRAAGNDLSVLYARELAGTLTAEDRNRLTYTAMLLGMPSSVKTTSAPTAADPNVLSRYLKENQPVSDAGKTDQFMSSVASAVEQKLKSSPYQAWNQIKGYGPTIEKLYPKMQSGSLTAQEKADLNLAMTQLGLGSLY